MVGDITIIDGPAINESSIIIILDLMIGGFLKVMHISTYVSTSTQLKKLFAIKLMHEAGILKNWGRA